jgi:ankyrin repeat protein
MIFDFKMSSYTNNLILHDAILKNDLNSVRKMNFTSINIKNLDGDTALHLACKNHNLKFAEFIYRYGGDIYIKNNENKTALDYLTTQELDYMYHLRDRLHGLGKYEYVPRPESKHHGLVSRAYTGMEAK